MRFNELLAGRARRRGDQALWRRFRPPSKSRSTKSAKALKSIPGAADVKAEEVEGLPLLSIEPNREALTRYGLSVADVQDVVATAIGGCEAGQIQEGDRRFDLVVRPAGRAAQRSRQDRESPGPPAPRSRGGARTWRPATKEGQRPAFFRFRPSPNVDIGEGFNQISRDNGKRRIVVQCNVRGRDIGSFVEEAQDKIAQLKLPAGSWLEWGGQFENLIAARKRLSVVVPLCFFLIFLLLFSTFSSVKHALLVFSGVPLALSGGVVALWLRDIPFSISAAVGFIALSGVAVLNGLVMVTFINQLRARGRNA